MIPPALFPERRRSEIVPAVRVDPAPARGPTPPRDEQAAVEDEPAALAPKPEPVVGVPEPDPVVVSSGAQPSEDVPPTGPARTPGGTARALARSSQQMASTSALPTPERSGLERLDAALVPRLQTGAHTVARAVAAPLRGVARAEDARAGRAVAWGVRHRRPLVLLAMALAVVGSAIHFQRYADIQQAEADRLAAAAEQTVSEPGRPASTPGGVLAGGAQVVGPALGTDVPDYVAARHEELAALAPGESRVAVISFGEYVTPEEALAGVPEGATIHAAQLRIPTAGEEPFQTEVVANDLIGSVQRALATPMGEFAEEESSLEELIPTVTDPAFVADYERRLEELRAIRNLVNSGAGTIFAIVVQAPVADLQAATESDLVRLVDVAPGETQVSRSGFFGLLPEDRDETTYGVAA